MANTLTKVGMVGIKCARDPRECLFRRPDLANVDKIDVLDPTAPVCFHPEAPGKGIDEPGKTHRWCKTERI